MRTRVKICCISSMAEARTAIDAGADALGLVGPMPSGPGVIDAQLARSIAQAAPAGVSTFLLTSLTSATDIAEQVLETGASTVQLVHHIDPAQSAALAGLLPRAIRIVQVIHVEDRSALTLLHRYLPHVHAFLLDSGRPSLEVPELGGTGRLHDWGVSAEFVRQSARPVFLAGGLTPANVADAIRIVRPFGLDVCSGLRTEGELDPHKLRVFMRAVRAADALA